jgi:hypothetical protein
MECGPWLTVRARLRSQTFEGEEKDDRIVIKRTRVAAVASEDTPPVLALEGLASPGVCAAVLESVVLSAQVQAHTHTLSST